MQQVRALTPRWTLSVPPGARTPGARTLAVLSGEHSGGPVYRLAASALTGLLQAGWSDEDACRAVELSPGLCDLVGPEQRRGRSWLRRVTAAQHAWIAEHPASDYAPGLRVELTAARQQLHSWAPSAELRERVPVPQLANLLAVGDAVLELADELGREQHLSCGVRELAERSGVAVGTVRKALRVWRAVGLVVQVEPSRWADGVQLAATYRLELSVLAGDSESEVLVSSAAARTVRHDAWRHGALGHGGWAAWALLRTDIAADADELAVLLRVSRRTVLRRLERLELHRLVTRTAYGWTRCDDAQAGELLTAAAVHEQSAGTGELQRARHLSERTQRREQHERWLAHRKAEYRRELLDHAVREPDELVPLGDLARERVPADGWGVQVAAELVQAGRAVRVAHGRTLQQFADEQRRQFAQVQDALAAPLAELERVARGVQAAGERVARWAAEHEHELAAERVRQGVQSG
jgi:hypothetical protein